jgi:hypothetical protein
MPISGFQRPLMAWAQESIAKADARPGIFELYDQYEAIIYIAASQNVKESMQTLFTTGTAAKPCLNQATHVRFEYVEKPDLALKNHMIVFQSSSGGQLPECNQ